MATGTTQARATQPTWQELLGSKNWEGLLDPLDLDHRNLILLCGDLIQATYDSFNNDQYSLYCGSCRYGKSSFFRKVQFPDPTGYDVVSYLYATAQLNVPEAFLLHSLSRDSWDRESNWIGYVAASSDQRAAATGRREIFVVWRGTTRYWNWNSY